MAAGHRCVTYGDEAKRDDTAIDLLSEGLARNQHIRYVGRQTGEGLCPPLGRRDPGRGGVTHVVLRRAPVVSARRVGRLDRHRLAVEHPR